LREFVVDGGGRESVREERRLPKWGVWSRQLVCHRGLVGRSCHGEKMLGSREYAVTVL